MKVSFNVLSVTGLTVVGRIMVWRTDETQRAEIRHETGNIAFVNALSFSHQVQLFAKHTHTHMQDLTVRRLSN
jgi:hypothetical protein